MEHRWGFRQSTDLIVRFAAGASIEPPGRLLNQVRMAGANPPKIVKGPL
jgi:hypothetical protein